MNKGPAIIVKRGTKKGNVKKRNPWRGMLSDFCMLAMSLFLLLWLAGFSSPEQKTAISTYFQTPDDMDNIKQAVIAVQHAEKLKAEALATDVETVIAQTTHVYSVRDKLYNSLQVQIQQQLERLPAEYSDALIISKNNRGLSLEILELEGQPMFNRGSDRLTHTYQQMILKLAKYLKKTGRNISILGHTDSTRFSSNSSRDNWDLSTARAQSARRVLVRGGFPAQRIAQVSGMADKRLKDPDNPGSARNRRVEIVVTVSED